MSNTKIVDMYQCLWQINYFVEQMDQNKIFVYPTDSLYGIGWLFSHENIEKISQIKKRHMGKKMNIIAPSFSWIFENFKVENPDFLLESFNSHHAITFILEPKFHHSSVSLYETLYDNDTVWVRIIKHPFQELITKLWKPFISTSANFTNERNIRNIRDLDQGIIDKVDFVIDWHDVSGIPSTLIFDKNQEFQRRH